MSFLSKYEKVKSTFEDYGAELENRDLMISTLFSCMFDVSALALGVLRDIDESLPVELEGEWDIEFQDDDDEDAFLNKLERGTGSVVHDAMVLKHMASLVSQMEASTYYLARIAKKISCRPRKRYFERAKPAIELSRRVSTTATTDTPALLAKKRVKGSLRQATEKFSGCHWSGSSSGRAICASSLQAVTNI